MSISVVPEPAIKRRKLSHSTNRESDAGVAGDSDDQEQQLTRQKRVTKPLPNSRSSSTKPTPSSVAGMGSSTRSSVMMLQVDELLNAEKFTLDAKLRDVGTILNQVIEAIKSIPARPSLSLAQAEKQLRKHQIAIPFGMHRPAADVKYQFVYEKPQVIQMRHDLVSQLSIASDKSAELFVEMPATIFQEKDYLNHRAFHKRAYYLACIALELKTKLAKGFNCHYTLQDGNSLVPVISLQQMAEQTASHDIQIHVHATFPPSLGPPDKVLPGKNCIRNENDKTNTAGSLSPTPLYNSTLRSIASLDMLDKVLEAAAKKCEAFRDACLLGQIWLQQRGFGHSMEQGGFGPIEWALMCALLLVGGGHRDQPLFSSKYSSVQLFKAMLQVLSGRNLIEQPMIIDDATAKMDSPNIPIVYHMALGVNILYKMSIWSYEALKHQAQISLTTANARNLDGFDSLFITKVADVATEFDEYYTLDVSTISNGQTIPQESLTKLYSTLVRGLGERVSLLKLREINKASWEFKRQEPVSSGPTHIEIALLVNSEAASRTVDHGPTAEEQEEAKDFRQFWGPKSELRRFRDGRITETLVWSSSLPVTYQIIQYLLLFHFQLPPSSLKQKSQDLYKLCLSTSTSISSGDAFNLINTKYQELSSKMHQLEGMPLPIRSINPADSALRSASIGHPLDPATAMPISIVIQFDSSARWPDHLAAIQYTKVAFLAKLGDLLTESDSSLTTRIGLEGTDSSTTGYQNTSFLDVIHPSPAPGLSPIIFRLRIHHEREQSLLEKAGSLASSQLRETITSALAEYRSRFIASPVHTVALRNLITHFPPLSSTIHLIKTWTAHHNLTNHVPPPVLEIIASHVFLHPAPWSTPGSSTTAFLRCLHFLSRWDWTATPLITDLSLAQDMPAQSYQELDTRFQAWKKLDPAMNNVAWFIGTNIDNTGTVWTQNARPARVVAGRVTALARAAIELVRSKGIAMEETDWKSLFVSSLVDFDFVLHLKKNLVRGRRSGSRKSDVVKFKNLQVQEDMDVERIGHDVVELFLADLEKSFGHSILFFHGQGGGVIAGLWKPSTMGLKEWRVRLGWSSTPAALEADEQHAAKCVINKDAMLAEMAMLGEDMIEKVTVKGQ